MICLFTEARIGVIDIHVWSSFFLQRTKISWDGHGRADLVFNDDFDASANADHRVIKTGILQILEGTSLQASWVFCSSSEVHSQVESRLSDYWRPESSSLDGTDQTESIVFSHYIYSAEGIISILLASCGFSPHHFVIQRRNRDKRKSVVFFFSFSCYVLFVVCHFVLFFHCYEDMLTLGWRIYIYIIILILLLLYYYYIDTQIYFKYIHALSLELFTWLAQ